jgi:hypothetical protein
MRPRTIGAIAVTVLAAACGRDKPVPPAEGGPPAGTEAPATPAAGSPQVAAFTATDYAFDGPSETPAGPTRFTLTNRGKEAHHLVVVRIEGGRTYDSLLAALKKPELPPRWAHPIGGPNGVSPALESEAEITLTPGAYAIVCFVPTANGVPHLAKGMIRPLTVTPSNRQASAAAPDLTMDLTDYDFKLSAPITAGTRVVRVVNAAAQLHEVVVVRLDKGKTMQDMFTWEVSGRKGAAPGRYVGGMSPIAPGDTADFSLAFEPGSYALICFLPDAKDGKFHAMHGMLKTLTVS